MSLAMFSFMTASEIMFGRGQARHAAGRIQALGQRVLLVHGSNSGRADWLVADLHSKGCQVERFVAGHEPDLALVEAGVAVARVVQADTVVALGGGSVVDTGKAIAALVPATRPMVDHLEVVGSGLPLDHAPLTFVALPTTSGTGAEVTRNAVIGVPSHQRKVSLRDNRMLADLAIVDPALTDGSPRAVTLESGLDAVTQLIEPYICNRANPMTDALCRDAIPIGLKSLVGLMDREDPDCRDGLSWASLCGGLALANSGLGVVHGLAGPLGGLVAAPHGAICGALLPHALKANRAAVADRDIARRIDEVLGWIAHALSTEPQNALDALVSWSKNAGLRSLGEFGVTSAVELAAVEAAAVSSSMKANPVRFSHDDLTAILRAAL